MKTRSNWGLWMAAALAPFIAYLGMAILVFDFGETAFPDDEDNTADGHPVAIGPRPRRMFCRPTVQDVYWRGREWPFVVFAPVCSWWRERHGFAPSAEWR